MLAYFLFAAIFLGAAALAPQRKPNAFAWAGAWVVVVLFVGLRHKVGMDWNNYLVMARYMGAGSLLDSLRFAEPGFAVLLWTSQRLGAGVYGANLVAAAIFAFGLFRFARTTPLPWVALAVAVPILVVVVAMSANRQSVAIGILLWLSADWEHSSLTRRVGLTLLAAMFHYSAIFFLLFCALGLPIRRGYRRILVVLLAAGLLAFLDYSGSGGYYARMYLGSRRELTYSAGALQHVLLNGLPAALLLLPRSQRKVVLPTQLLRHMALVALLLVPTALFLSGPAGRMTLYLFPVSMYAFSALPSLFGNDVVRAFARTCIAAVQLGILAVWLAFSNSREAHDPYRNALFMAPSELHIDRGQSKESLKLQRRRHAPRAAGLRG